MDICVHSCQVFKDGVLGVAASGDENICETLLFSSIIDFNGAERQQSTPNEQVIQ